MQQEDDPASDSPSIGAVDVLGEGELCGYLRKNSTRKRNVWRRRWCVVKDGRLWYCKERCDQHELSFISLAGSSIHEAKELSVPHCFELQTAAAAHQLCAPSAQELLEWCAVLRQHIDLASENELLSSAEMLICDNEHASATRDGRALELAESSLEGLLCHPRGYRLLLEHASLEPPAGGGGAGSGEVGGEIRAPEVDVGAFEGGGDGAEVENSLRRPLAFLARVQRYREQCQLCDAQQGSSGTSGGGGGGGGGGIGGAGSGGEGATPDGDGRGEGAASEGGGGGIFSSILSMGSSLLGGGGAAAASGGSSAGHGNGGEAARGSGSGARGSQSARGSSFEAWRQAKAIMTTFLEGQIELDSFERAAVFGRADTLTSTASSPTTEEMAAVGGAAAATVPPPPPTDLFDTLKAEVLRRLEASEYQRLLQSPHYQRLLLSIPLDRQPTLTPSYAFAAKAATAALAVRAEADAKANSEGEGGDCGGGV
jgi:hypothetical protein